MKLEVLSGARQLRLLCFTGMRVEVTGFDTLTLLMHHRRVSGAAFVIFCQQ